MNTLKYSERIKQYLGTQFNLQEEQVELMMPNFIATLSIHMQNLDRAVQEKSLSQIGRAVHTIKGAFMNLGLSDCAEIAKEIEKGCSTSDEHLDYQLLVGKLGRIVNDIINE